MRPLRSLSVFVALLALALSGCDDDFLPFVEGTYQLVRAEGAPLPFTLWDTGAEDATLLNERLTFRSDGTVERRTLRRFREGNPVQQREEWVVMEQEYRLEGRTITVGWFTPCPPNAMCLGNDSGRASRDRVILSSVLHSDDATGVTLEYRRE